MPNLSDIYWLAGFLEGEGSFNIYRHSNGTSKVFRITASSTDADTIDKVSKIIHGFGKFTSYHNGDSSRKRVYQYSLVGNLAIQWMMTLYPLMSTRRRSQIKVVISIWKAYSPHRGRKENSYEAHPQT